MTFLLQNFDWKEYLEEKQMRNSFDLHFFFITFVFAVFPRLTWPLWQLKSLNFVQSLVNWKHSFKSNSIKSENNTMSLKISPSYNLNQNLKNLSPSHRLPLQSSWSGSPSCPHCMLLEHQVSSLVRGKMFVRSYSESIDKNILVF